MRWPALSLGAFVLVMVLLFLFNAGGAGYVGGRLEAAGIDLPLDGLIYGGIFGLWLVVFCFSSAYFVTQHWFNAADGHPLLAPLMAGWMAWVAAANTLISATVTAACPRTSSSVCRSGLLWSRPRSPPRRGGARHRRLKRAISPIRAA
jgi:hypothetical protein